MIFKMLYSFIGIHIIYIKNKILLMKWLVPNSLILLRFNSYFRNVCNKLMIKCFIIEPILARNIPRLLI